MAGGTALDDIAAASADTDDDMASTNFGKMVASRNFGALKMVSSVLLAVTGAVELYAIFT